MSTDRISYGTSTAITCTLASLASSATAGRMSAYVDNTTNLFDDAMLTVTVVTSATALANDLACYVYIYGSEDGSTYSGSSAEAQGTDAACTFDSPTNMKGPYAISCPATSVTYRLVVGSIASLFGGVMPRRWGFALRNYTGQALAAAGNASTYTGINYTDT